MIEYNIYKILNEAKDNCFINCYTIENKENKFYSPFILGLMGILLIQSKDDKVTDILDSIETKLLNTHNKNGIYNFYGNDTYYYDIDTTAIVNIFFLLKNSKNAEYHKNIITQLKKNIDVNENLLKTWINRDRNHIDWFVNYNFLTYTILADLKDAKIEKELKLRKGDFLKNGTRYYNDISFPLFYIIFNLAEFGIDFSFESHTNSKTKNLFQYGTEYIIKQKRKQITDNWLNSNEVYFNSSKERYSSTELGATILLYLTNLKFNNYE